jgi:hypothetical protein
MNEPAPANRRCLVSFPKRTNRLETVPDKVPHFRLTARVLAGLLIVAACHGVLGTEFADSRQAEQWLRHPVYGDASFDAFERVPGNPIFRGSAPFEWPVNGFLFHDPVGGHDYAYIGDYCRGYLARPSRCVLFCSTNGMRSWSNLGVVLQGNRDMFDRGGHTPDVSVAFDAGRYHMVYDWGKPDFNAEGGLAYAWADRPEGPWHRAPQPITRNSTLPKLLGKYRRTYAGTLVRRKHDWLILAMMDAAPNSWALFVMTAPQPEGPWSERRLVRNVESELFHPPLMEFFPAFVTGGFVYAPATSVALNRDFNALFRAPVEQAADPAAWELCQYGSLWHSEDVEHENYGLWGQTFAGRVAPGGVLWALFNSRDAQGLGTVSLARRPWDQPLRAHGFVLSGHDGPSFTCLRQSFPEFKLDAGLRLRGTALVLWDYRGALGPNRPQSDATLHPLARTSFDALELSPAGWRVVRVDVQGLAQSLASGPAENRGQWQLKIERKADGRLSILGNGQPLWSGQIRPSGDSTRSGPLGLWVEPHTHLVVDQFEVRGRMVPARLDYLATEALLGAGEAVADWQERRGPLFHRGLGFVSRKNNAHVKWNVSGSRLTLWSPCGPEFGEAELRVDGHRAGTVDLHALETGPSKPVWTSGKLSGRYHAVVWQSLTGALPVDCLEAEE